MRPSTRETLSTGTPTLWARCRAVVVAAVTLIASVVMASASASAADNPNPARITEASWWLMQEMLELEPGTENGGMYVNKVGYHNTRAANPSGDYSVRDAEDQGGPSDKAAAYDWTFPEAWSETLRSSEVDSHPVPPPPSNVQATPDYRRIIRYSNRLLASGKDPGDPRLDGWREFLGQIDEDRTAEAWDFRDDYAKTPDPNHIWHIHLSEDRDKVTSFENKEKLLSVLRGETVEQWLNRPDPARADDGSSAQARADVDGNGSADLVMLYDYGDSSSRLWVSLTPGELSPEIAKPVPWWNSDPGQWDASRSKLAVADYNKDGKADVGILYDYGGKNTKFWVFISTGIAFVKPVPWWTSEPGQWDASRSKLAVGYYNDDEFADVGILYDYGGKNSRFWVLISTGEKFANPAPWWTSEAGQWDASRSKLVVGYYNKDGFADVGILYDYGGKTSTFWVLISTGSGFAAPKPWWESAAGQWDASRSKVAVGDYNEDGESDLGILYDYGDKNTRFWVLLSTGLKFATPSPWWNSELGQWDASRTKLN